MGKESKRQVVCPWCWGEKKVIVGHSEFNKDGTSYQVARKVKCFACDGKGKGDFDITPEQLRAALAKMEILG